MESRRSIRTRLNCHSFKWYLDNVFPEKFILDENVLAYGAVSSADLRTIDTPVRPIDLLGPKSGVEPLLGHRGQGRERNDTTGCVLLPEWRVGQSVFLAVEDRSVASGGYVFSGQWTCVGFHTGEHLSM